MVLGCCGLLVFTFATFTFAIFAFVTFTQDRASFSKNENIVYQTNTKTYLSVSLRKDSRLSSCTGVLCRI